MCGPVSASPGSEDESHLCSLWLYQLQHGNQLRMCFPCFKLHYMGLQESLESGDWENEDGGPEPMEPEWWQGTGQPAQAGFGGWESDTLAPQPDGSGEVGQDQYFMPTELTPQTAAPLGLGPEDADWTQGLPWRLGEVPACSHWPSPDVPWQSFLNQVLPPSEPMLLELGTTQEVDPAEAEAWLLSLQVMSMVSGSNATYLRHMGARWALRKPGRGWDVLLEPDDRCLVQLQSTLQGPELDQWRLSFLEASPTGYGFLLVPADKVLLGRGFSILNYSPWDKSEAEEGGVASEPGSSPQGQGPGSARTYRRGPSGVGESLGPGIAAVFPVLEMVDEAQVTTGLSQDHRGWEGLATAPPPEPGEPWTKEGDLGPWWGNGEWPRD